MSTINFYRQTRKDGGVRTGIEIDGEPVLGLFENPKRPEDSDSALLWFVDVRCSGGSLPNEPEEVRDWLLKNSAMLQKGLLELAEKLRAGIDFSAPIEHKLTSLLKGVKAWISCSAIKRLQALDMAKALEDINSHWEQYIQKLQPLETLTR